MEVADKIIEINPEDASAESGHLIKAKALRQLNRPDEEAEILRSIAIRSSDAMPVFLRLLELDTAAQRWPEVALNAARAMALNPFLKTPQLALATALAPSGDGAGAIAAYQRLLLLEPDNPADVRFRLASLMRNADPAAAKKHLIDALVLAPRFREAHALLIEMQTAPVKEGTPP